MQKIKKGDLVVVITGKDKGKQGNVKEVMPKEQKVIVEGVNVVTRHQKPNQTSGGGIVKKEMALSWSNVAHIDPKTGKQTRVRIEKDDEGNKVRVAVKSGEKIGKES